jgi:RNA polymerase sigma factor (TIGR02999 family)
MPPEDDSRLDPSLMGAIPPGLDQDAINHLFSVAYEELRGLAATIRRSDPAATLNPTALVHEAWVKLAHSPPAGFNSRLHFKRVAARAMRQLLVESARRRSAQKRGGTAVAQVSFEEAIDKPESTSDEVLRLDAALDTLARLNPRQAAMVESRFFGGMETAEIAELLQISEATVLRDWRAAKAWLATEVRRGA